MVPSGPKIAILKKMAKDSGDENDVRLAKTITPARRFIVRGYAEGTVFGAFDNEPLLLHTTVNSVNTDILIITGACKLLGFLLLN